ncbi:MAG: metallophosphoesterase [Methyloligellaceae bacterium]
MRICYFSDLHLEHYDYKHKFPEADILLLAGDICRAVDLAEYHNNPCRMERRDHAMWFFDELLERFPHIIYCMGNHEHLDFDFYETHDALRHALPTGITILNKEHVEINGAVFYGATLWTDFNDADRDDTANATQKMPEYKYVSAGNSLLTPEITMQDHNLALSNLSRLAAADRSKPVITVTHHSPSLLGLNNSVHNPSLQRAFASDLDFFIKSHNNIRHWIFGHTHIQRKFEIGHCQLAANCRGYRELEQSAHTFSPQISFNFSVNPQSETKEYIAAATTP